MSDISRPAPPTPASSRPLSQCSTLGQVFESAEFQHRVVQSLPSHMKPGTVMRSFAQAVSRQPDLMKVDLRQAIGGFLTLAELGLPLTPALGMAHMIPFRSRIYNRAARRWEDGYVLQIIIGYQGLIELAMRSGLVGGIHAEVVWPGDEFKFRLGTQQFLDHTPRGEQQPSSKPEWAWAIAHLRGDVMPPFEVYPWRKVLGIRDRSQGYLKALAARDEALKEGRAVPRTYTDAPWVRDEEAMARKTMIRALSKYLPKSAELQGAAAVDDPERGYVDFSPIVDARPGEVTAADLGTEDEVAPDAAFGVRQQPEAKAAPAAQAAPRARQQPAQHAVQPAASARPPAGAAPSQAPDEPPPASEADYFDGIPESMPAAKAASAYVSAAIEFEAHVFDEVGEAATDLHSDPVAWAQSFRRMLDAAPEDARQQIIENNLDALAAATPSAPDLLDGIAALGAPPQAKPRLQPAAPVPVPHGRGGKPDWPGYIKAIRETLPALGITIQPEAWALAQVETLAGCPAQHRLALVADISRRLGEMGHALPGAFQPLLNAAPPAEEPKAAAPADVPPGGDLFGAEEAPAEMDDAQWIEATKARIAACASVPDIQAISKSADVTARLAALKVRNPEMAADLRAFATRHAQSLQGAAP